MDEGVELPWESEELLQAISRAYASEGLQTAWNRESPAVGEALKQISQHLRPVRYAAIGVLGVGGSAIVLRVRDKLFPEVDNALKFPRPIERVAGTLAEMIASELRSLAGLRHPSLVRILYYRTVPDVNPYGNFPFYLTEVIEGGSSESYLHSNARPSALINLILGTARVLAYLHGHSATPFVHLDVKPGNVIVTENGHPVLLDLGTCKQLNGRSDQTVLAFTPGFAHPDQVRHMISEVKSGRALVGRIPRTAIQPGWDLWALGKTILSWMGIDPETGRASDGALANQVDAYTRKYLFLLCARLLVDEPIHWLGKKVGVDQDLLKSMAIRSADNLVLQLEKLTGAYDPTRLVPEMTPASTGSIQAAPGVHVTNTQRLTRTLEHRLFRRLNSVTQLGLVSQVFPSARHTRRDHSLGTYGNVCRMIKALYDDPMSPLFKQAIAESDIREILLTSLLHDLGQFPMAHDLEDIDSKIFDHEDLTASMLRGHWKTGKKGSRRLTFESLSGVFQMWGTIPDRIISILSAKAKSGSASQKDKLLRSIISGPIDADKLDYLFRDARYTDVPYPNGIDVDRLFRCLTTVIVPKIRGGIENVPVIGVHAKGKIAAEFMTMARYAMFSQVYWHHAVRAQKAMLSRATSALLAQLSATKTEEFRSSFLSMVCGLPESMYRETATQKALGLEAPSGVGLNAGSEGEVGEQDGTSQEEPSMPDTGSGTDLVATDAAVLTWLRDRMRAHALVEAELIQGILTRSLFKRLWVVSRENVRGAEWDELCDVWSKLTAKQRNIASIAFEQKVRKRLNTGDGPQDITQLRGSEAKEIVAQLSESRTPWLLVDLPGAKSGSDVGLHYVTEVQARRMRKDDAAVGTVEKSAAWDRYAGDLRAEAGKVRIFCRENLVETVDVSISQVQGFADLLEVVQAASIHRTR